MQKSVRGRWDRPELHRLLDQLRSGDTLVVWKLDRLSRSLKDLLAILERIDTAGGKFRSLTEAIDTSGPAGRMMMQMLGSSRAPAIDALAFGVHFNRRDEARQSRSNAASIWPIFSFGSPSPRPCSTIICSA